MSEKRERVSAKERADKLRYTCYPLTLMAAKDKAFDEMVKAIKEAEAQARAEGYEKGWRECREELERKLIPSRPEFNMLATLTHLELQTALRSLQPPSEAGR